MGRECWMWFRDFFKLVTRCKYENKKKVNMRSLSLYVIMRHFTIYRYNTLQAKFKGKLFCGKFSSVPPSPQKNGCFRLGTVEKIPLNIAVLKVVPPLCGYQNFMLCCGEPSNTHTTLAAHNVVCTLCCTYNIIMKDLAEIQ